MDRLEPEHRGLDAIVQLDFLDLKNETSLIHLSRLQTEGFSGSRGGQEPINILSVVTKAGGDRCKIP